MLIAVAVLGCDKRPGEDSQADRVMEELRGLYEKALEEAPEDAVEWAKEDIGRYGDWEYRVVVIPEEAGEALETRLNELGAERWEVFWMERAGADLRLFLKRPAKSYLRSVPLSGLGTAISGGESEE
jgi:hypothetical protein